MSLEILEDDFRFNGIVAPPVAASVLEGPWASKITKTAGSPTCSSAAGGGMALTLDATAEIQNVCLYMGDVLSYPIAQIVQVEFWASLTASLNAAITASFGLASARNDTPTSISDYCLFQCVGNNNLVISSTDGTNTQSAVATGQTVAASPWQKFVMEFKTGINTVSGGLSTGGKSNIWLSAEGNAQGVLRRVASGTLFSMAADTGNLQLFAQIQKTAVAAGATLTIQRAKIRYRPY